MYCGGNPIRYKDPTGHYGEEQGWGGTTGYGSTNKKNTAPVSQSKLPPTLKAAVVESKLYKAKSTSERIGDVAKSAAVTILAAPAIMVLGDDPSSPNAYSDIDEMFSKNFKTKDEKLGHSIGNGIVAGVAVGAALAGAKTKVKIKVNSKSWKPASRPNGVPRKWNTKKSKKGGGTIYSDPDNSHNSVRVMPGNPKSSYENSRTPYVRHLKNGQSLDKFGSNVDRTSPEAHIPLKEFKYPKVDK